MTSQLVRVFTQRLESPLYFCYNKVVVRVRSACLYPLLSTAQKLVCVGHTNAQSRVHRRVPLPLGLVPFVFGGFRWYLAGELWLELAGQ